MLKILYCDLLKYFVFIFLLLIMPA